MEPIKCVGRMSDDMITLDNFKSGNTNEEKDHSEKIKCPNIGTMETSELIEMVNFLKKRSDKIDFTMYTSGVICLKATGEMERDIYTLQKEFTEYEITNEVSAKFDSRRVLQELKLLDFEKIKKGQIQVSMAEKDDSPIIFSIGKNLICIAPRVEY